LGRMLRPHARRGPELASERHRRSHNSGGVQLVGARHLGSLRDPVVRATAAPIGRQRSGRKVGMLLRLADVPALAGGCGVSSRAKVARTCLRGLRPRGFTDVKVGISLSDDGHRPPATGHDGVRAPGLRAMGRPRPVPLDSRVHRRPRAGRARGPSGRGDVEPAAVQAVRDSRPTEQLRRRSCSPPRLGEPVAIGQPQDAAGSHRLPAANASTARGGIGQGRAASTVPV
jgi:hypothetical protein